MMEVKNQYCYKCSVEFDKKCIFNDHLSDVHGIVFHEKPVPQPSVIPEANDIDIKYQDEEKAWKTRKKKKSVGKGCIKPQRKAKIQM